MTIEEEHIARETLNRWNAENGKEKGKVFLPLPSDSTADPDIYVMPIDNYVDTSKENTIIATSKPVILLFSKYHDEDNTILAELKEVEALKNEKVPNCVKATYNGNRDRIMIWEKIFRRDTVCHFASLRKSIDYFSLLSLYN